MIDKLQLTNFRNHSQRIIDFAQQKLVAIIGDNGSGKTSIIEAISLLLPGKGFRVQQLEEIISHTQESPAGASFKSGDNANSVAMKTGLTEREKRHFWRADFVLSDGNELACFYGDGKRKKQLLFNDNLLTSHKEMLDLMRVIWLTPEMDGIFKAAAAKKRQFLDRLTYNLHSIHADNYLRYNHYLKSRLQLLKTGYLDDNMLLSLEWLVAEFAIKMAIHRLQTIATLNYVVLQNSHKFAWQKAVIGIRSEVEQIISEHLGWQAERLIVDNLQAINLDENKLLQLFQHKVADTLKKRRNIDAAAKKSTYGPHCANFFAYDLNKSIELSQCSTGEQKYFLVNLIAAQAEALVQRIYHGPIGAKPKIILLLDDLLSHFDCLRQSDLIQQIAYHPDIQIIVTTTDLHGLEGALNPFREGLIVQL